MPQSEFWPQINVVRAPYVAEGHQPPQDHRTTPTEPEQGDRLKGVRERGYIPPRCYPSTSPRPTPKHSDKPRLPRPSFVTDTLTCYYHWHWLSLTLMFYYHWHLLVTDTGCHWHWLSLTLTVTDDDCFWHWLSLTLTCHWHWYLSQE